MLQWTDRPQEHQAILLFFFLPLNLIDQFRILNIGLDLECNRDSCGWICHLHLTPYISLTCKLGPVLYQQYENDLLPHGIGNPKLWSHNMEGRSGQKCNLIATCIPLDRIRVPLDRTFIPLGRTFLPFDRTSIILSLAILHWFIPLWHFTFVRTSVQIAFYRIVLNNRSAVVTIWSAMKRGRQTSISCSCRDIRLTTWRKIARRASDVMTQTRLISGLHTANLRTFAPKSSHTQIFLKLWLQVENDQIKLKT